MVKNTLRRLSKPYDLFEDDMRVALNEAVTSSPRAAAIVISALVEDALRWCLCGRLIPHINESDVFDSEAAPLNTFHSKIIMGYSLGVYGTITRDDLMRIKFIRNAFAHAPRAITFDTPNVSALCLELGYLDHVLANIPSRTQVTDPRKKLLETATLMIMHLHAVSSPEDTLDIMKLAAATPRDRNSSGELTLGDVITGEMP
jgi:hypothetical protein